MESTSKKIIPVVIPAYEPDSRLIELIKDLKATGFNRILIVNDGSGVKYDDIFKKTEELLIGTDSVILKHDVNRGKGRALKTAFKYILDNFCDAKGAVTADSDGQHTPQCIASVSEALETDPESLILGVRSFDGDDIPWKSKFGNSLTVRFLKFMTGIDVQDTQTGLRGIPVSFMKLLEDVPGERFEFETNMLLASRGKYPIRQVPIKTIYDSKTEHQTHFNGVTDSIKIYKAILKYKNRK